MHIDHYFIDLHPKQIAKYVVGILKQNRTFLGLATLIMIISFSPVAAADTERDLTESLAIDDPIFNTTNITTNQQSITISLTESLSVDDTASPTADHEVDLAESLTMNDAISGGAGRQVSLD